MLTSERIAKELNLAPLHDHWWSPAIVLDICNCGMVFKHHILKGYMLLFHWSLVLEGRNFGENSTLLVFLWLTWACILVVEAWYFTIVQSKGNMFESQKFRKKHLRDGTSSFSSFFPGMMGVFSRWSIFWWLLISYLSLLDYYIFPLHFFLHVVDYFHLLII